MNKKYKIARVINIIFCIGIVLMIMIHAYHEWNKYGDYGVFQFVVSLVYHGGSGIMIYFGIDWILRNIVFNQIK